MAVLLLCSLCAGQFFGTVNAEEYEDETMDTKEPIVAQQVLPDYTAFLENSPYGLYETLTPAQRNTYIRIQQFYQKRQQWLQNRLPYTQPRDFEAEAAEAAALEIAEAKLIEEAKSRITAERTRITEELQKIWHNPLVLDTYVTSPFGYRWHPVYGTYRMHYGVDLDSDYGDQVRATRGGIVVEAGWDYYYGYYVMIDHGDGFVSEYFHLCTYYVDVGQQVRYCEPIGQVGSTGVATGPHLHFGLLYEGEYVDPEDYIDFSA